MKTDPSGMKGRSGGLNRRGLLRRLAAASMFAGFAFQPEELEAGPLPSPDLLKRDPDRYWSRIRSQQFLLPDWRVFLNPGSLGVMPRPVLKEVIESMTRVAEYATDQTFRWGYETLENERVEMAEFLKCRPEELAFTHNCTEAMSYIAGGLELKAGDEIIITNQEHGSGTACWKLKAARVGVVIREVSIPVTPRVPEELIEPLVGAMGPKTKVISFSGVTTTTGLILPVKQICRVARERGVLSVVDGAHMDGQIPVNLHELECDYFAGSPHKWLFAPPGCGLLYGRGDMLDRLWPCVVSSGWDNKNGLHAARFMMIGTNNRANIDGMIAGLRFFKKLGEEEIYGRIHELARYARGEAAKRTYLEVVTPEDSRFFGSILSIKFKTDKLDAVWAGLKAKRVYVLGGQRLRLSFHIHTRRSDIDTFFKICDGVLG